MITHDQIVFTSKCAHMCSCDVCNFTDRAIDQFLYNLKQKSKNITSPRIYLTHTRRLTCFTHRPHITQSRV